MQLMEAFRNIGWDWSSDGRPATSYVILEDPSRCTLIKAEEAWLGLRPELPNSSSPTAFRRPERWVIGSFRRSASERKEPERPGGSFRLRRGSSVSNIAAELAQQQSSGPGRRGRWCSAGRAAAGGNRAAARAARFPRAESGELLYGAPVGLMHAGEAFGEAALMDSARTASVVAVSETSLLDVDQRSFVGSGMAGHYLGLLQELRFLAGARLRVPPRLAYAFQALVPAGRVAAAARIPVGEIAIIRTGRVSLHGARRAARAPAGAEERAAAPALGYVCAGGCVGEEVLLSGVLAATAAAARRCRWRWRWRWRWRRRRRRRRR